MRIAFFDTKDYDKIWFEKIAPIYGYDLVFYAEFTDEESLKKFMNHPLHVAHRERCKEIVTDRLCGDIVSE